MGVRRVVRSSYVQLIKSSLMRWTTTYMVKNYARKREMNFRYDMNYLHLSLGQQIYGRPIMLIDDARRNV